MGVLDEIGDQADKNIDKLKAATEQKIADNKAAEKQAQVPDPPDTSEAERR